MIIDRNDYLEHYGTLHRSGRYPWGSGGPEYATSRGFVGMIDGMRSKGMSETEIARGLGITTTQLRAARSIAKNEMKQADINMAQRLKDKGYSNVAIGERMGINESSVRALLAPGSADKADILQTTAALLKKHVDEKGAIDIGTGVELHLNISATKLRTAVAVLKEQGYVTHDVKITQLGTGKQTTIKVLARADQPWSELVKDPSKIGSVTEFSPDGGRTYLGIQPPLSINSNRVGIRYAEQGGKTADGVIFVRPGVSDVSLGGNQYAQVRVAVDGTHYIKGMAIYKKDLPDGVDLVFNTNKNDTGNKLDALKPMKDDPENPFGSAIKRQLLEHVDGKTTVTSAMNIVNEAGDWENWSRSLSTQFLSKQSPKLAVGQLDLTYANRKSSLEEIMSLTNPTVRKKMLDSFAEDVDSAAVHLKAAALPRQATHVILPVSKMKENEVYAPNYRNGEKVVLVRHPHGGKFEIPELTVNNNHPEAKRLLGQAKDAIGISSKVAERLSGADFDGDTVLVIPNNSRGVKTTPALEGLKNFDAKASYPPYDGMRTVDGGIYRADTKTVEYGPKGPHAAGMQHKMGDVSNLIADMTIRGANTSELAAAVRHSMVVIDSEKHVLDYKQSYQDNGIAALKTKYQNSARGGASTLITRASSDLRVPKRKPRSASEGGAVDRATGRRVFTPTGESYVNAKGKTIFPTEKTTRLAETHDAHTLSSGTPIEKIYADHSNRLKELANQARLASIETKTIPYSPSANKVYAKQVDRLNAALNLALRNAPLERQAQILANAKVKAKREANPNMDAADLKKIKSQALIEGRLRTGAGKQRITISEEEWAAIQAGAISNHKLEQILANADQNQLKKLATPRTPTVMTQVKQDRAKAMLASGYTQAEIADALGVALSTLKSSISEEGT